MSDPRPRRLSALADGLTAAHIDGLLITSLPNIRYLTGFSGSSALLFVSVRDVVLITDFRYQTQVVDEVGDLARVSIEPQSLWTGLWQQLAQLTNLEVVGFESGHCCIAIFSGCSRQVRGGSGGLQWISSRRCASEKTRASSRSSGSEWHRDARARTTLPQVRIGMTELEVAGVLEKALRDEGSEGFPFPSIVASGPRSALPHARSSARRVEAEIFSSSTSAPRPAAIARTSRERS